VIRFVAVFLALSVALAACGGDGSGSISGRSDTPVATPAATASSQASKPTSEELLTGVSGAVAGFTSSDIRSSAAGATALFTSTATTAGGANVLVLVNVSACDPFICSKLNPADYQSAEAQRALKSTLPSVHIENPALHWEFDAIQFAPGKAGLFIYGLSYVETKDAAGGTTRASTNAYRAWFHDGRTLIAMDVFSRGGQSAKSTADLEKNMSRTDAEAAAKAVFAAIAAELMR
jgi:hypothetical protein